MFYLQRVIVIATDMLLIGLADSEMISRLGDLAISLFRLGEHDSLLHNRISIRFGLQYSNGDH